MGWYGGGPGRCGCVSSSGKGFGVAWQVCGANASMQVCHHRLCGYGFRWVRDTVVLGAAWDADARHWCAMRLPRCCHPACRRSYGVLLKDVPYSVLSLRRTVPHSAMVAMC